MESPFLSSKASATDLGKPFKPRAYITHLSKRKMEKPRCFKCDAECSSFLVWLLPTAKGNLILLYCNECGAVQGVVREEKIQNS